MLLEESRILLVDDEPNVLHALTRLLKNYSVTSFTSGEEALLAAKESQFDLVISDYRMPDLSGVEFLTFFKVLQPDAIRLILTGYADLKGIQQAINEAEVFRFINKPWNNFEILNAVTRGLEHRHVLIENRRLAGEVRRQRALLKEQDAILQALEAKDPGITKVNWGPDGSIFIKAEDYGFE
ncbi:MAG: response regulator [Methylobacter sp.]|nr:MAG: response regulator [Methylobacter sp.]PPD19186.1 MAG: response regulator [Methylobacter sp.]